jgi:hypothetical protein
MGTVKAVFLKLAAVAAGRLLRLKLYGVLGGIWHLNFARLG